MGKRSEERDINRCTIAAKESNGYIHWESCFDRSGRFLKDMEEESTAVLFQ